MMRDKSDGPVLTRRFYWSVLAVALAIAFLKRAQVFAAPDFPLGEGGLFVLFSQTILNNDFAMPGHITYGGVTIPFAYPPAGFYLASFVAKVLGADLLSVYYWLPILLNMLGAGAFCFLAAQLTRDRVVFLCASILYVQLPDSFVWQVTGGGLPRSLSAIFAFLAVGLALRVAKTSSKKELLLCGTCVGLSILSHLEWGLFSAGGTALTFLTRTGGWRRAILLTAAVGTTAFVVISPWIAAILSRHGVDPFLSSSSASTWNAGIFITSSLTGRIFGLLVWPAILGTFVTVGRRDWFLISWTVLTMLLTPRMGISAGLAIPASLLAGYGFKAAGEFASGLIASAGQSFWSGFDLAKRSWLGISVSTLALLVITSLALATPVRWLAHDPSIVEQVNQPSRDAMRWIRQQTEPDSSFVIVSGAQSWFLDRTAEWFPFLAERNSLTTAQGLEWAGPGVFVEKIDEIETFKLLQKVAPDLTGSFLHERYCAADYVAVFLPTAAPARQSLLASAAVQPVFSNEEAAVFRFQQTGLNCHSASPHPG